MTQETSPVNWPRYQPPKTAAGIPTADFSQSKLLLKAIRVFGRTKIPRSRSGKRGLLSKDVIAIRHKKPKFW